MHSLKSYSYSSGQLGRVIALIGLLAACAIAQIDTGAIVGTVHDPTGAPISNATVSVINRATNQALDTKTNAVGEYAFNVLQPGSLHGSGLH